LCYANRHLRDNSYVVLEALREYGLALEYASDELKAEIAECWVNAREPEVKNDN
jgi:hypothetical protein